MHHPRLWILLAAVAAFVLRPAFSADSASGYFRMGDARLDVSHAIAVVEERFESGEDNHTLVFLSAMPLDAQTVAAAFDAMDGVREQEPKGGYIRLCIDA